MRLFWTVALALSLGCSPTPQTNEEPAEAERKSDESSRVIGELHDGGQRHRVKPLILHPAHMDFRVGCLVDRDQARKRGDTPRPLCFDEDRRPSPPKKLRIEYRLGMQVSESMKRLAGGGEAAHFVIEATGTLYQVLDLAHAALRDGELRLDEVRILSGNTGGTDVLVEILQAHYGTLEIERVDVPPPSRGRAPQPAAAPGDPP